MLSGRPYDIEPGQFAIYSANLLRKLSDGQEHTGMRSPRGMKAVLICRTTAAQRSHDLTLEATEKPRRKGKGCTLLAEAKPLHHALVAVGIVSLEVVEQAATLAHQHEKTTARAVIFLVRFEVLRQLADPLT